MLFEVHPEIISHAGGYILCMFDYSRDTFLGQHWSQWHPDGWNQNSRLTSFEIFNSLRADMNSNHSVTVPAQHFNMPGFFRRWYSNIFRGFLTAVSVMILQYFNEPVDSSVAYPASCTAGISSGSPKSLRVGGLISNLTPRRFTSVSRIYVNMPLPKQNDTCTKQIYNWANLQRNMNVFFLLFSVGLPSACCQGPFIFEIYLGNLVEMQQKRIVHCRSDGCCVMILFVCCLNNIIAYSLNNNACYY